METSVEQLIKDRTFVSLTGEELEAVKELCASEEEFQTMKRFFQELEAVSASRKTIISPEVKDSLDSIFSAKYPGIRASWTAPEAVTTPVAPVIPLHQRTWVRVAAIAALLLGTVPFWNMLKTDVPVKDSTVTAQVSSDRKTQSVRKPASVSPAAETTAGEKSADAQAAAVAREYVTPEAIAVVNDENVVAETADTYLWSGATADKLTVTGAKDLETTMLSGTYMLTPQPSAVSFGFTAPAVSGNMKGMVTADSGTFARFGRNADLHPDDVPGENQTRTITCSLAEQPEDLLDLLVPAF